MLKWLKTTAFAFFLFFTTLSHGQGGCLWYHQRVFVLDVRVPAEWEMTLEPVITLVDEDSIPYQHEIYHSEPIITTTLVDILFAKNTPPDPQEPHHKGHSNPWYTTGLPEDVYTCWIPEHDKEPHSKLYQARIVVRHKQDVDTLFYPLPYSYALDPCPNELDQDKPAKRLKTMAGEDFVPRVIYLDQPPQPRHAPKPWSNVYFKFDKHKISGGAGKDSLLDLYQVRVFDVHSQALLQTIPINDALPFHPNLRYQNIETFDLFDDNPKGIPDFRYITDIVVDTSRNFSRTRYRQFLYDPEWSKFMTNEVLSGYFDVRKDAIAGGVTRHERVYAGDSLFIYRYRFEDDEWQFTRKDASYLGPPPKPKPPVISTCVEWEDHDILYDQVVWADSVNVVRHQRQIWIRNLCSEKILRSEFRSAWPRDITAAERIAPGDTSYIEVNFILNTYDGLIHLEERNVYVGYGTELPRTLVFQALVLGRGVQVVEKEGRPFQYVSRLNQDGFTVQVLEVDELGRPRQFGPARAGTLEKFDRWRMWNEEGKEIPSVEYLRKHTVSILNPEKITGPLKVLLKKGDTWLAQEHYTSGTSVVFYSVADPDSIQVIGDSARLSISATDQSYPWYGGYMGYLITPGDYTIETNSGATPLYFDLGALSIRWHEKWFAANSTPEAIEQEIERLQAAYGEIQFSRLWHEDTFWVARIPLVGGEARRDLVSALLAEGSVAGLSQVLTTNTGRDYIASPGFQIKVKQGASKELISETLRKHGFDEDIQGVTDPYYTGSDDTRVLDETYFSRLKALAEEDCILGVNPNFLFSFRAEPEMERD